MRTIILISYFFFSFSIVQSQPYLSKKRSSKNDYNTINQNIKQTNSVISYDNQIIGEGVGETNSFELGMIIELPPELLVNYQNETITHIRFGLENYQNIDKAEIKLFENRLNDSSIVYSETINPNQLIAGYNIKKLTKAYQIRNNIKLFVGIFLKSTDNGGYLGTIDTDGAQNPSYGGILYYNGAYIGTLSDRGIAGDWNLQAVTTNDGIYTGIRDLAIIDVFQNANNCQSPDSQLVNIIIKNLGDDTINEAILLNTTINDSLFTTTIPIHLLPDSQLIYTHKTLVFKDPGFYSTLFELDIKDVFKENNHYNKLLIQGDSFFEIFLNTDLWPNETHWTITNSLQQIVAESYLLNANTNYIERVCVPSNDCYRFTIYDENGDGLSSDGLTGSFLVKYNDSIIGFSPDDANFGYEYNINKIGNSCSSYDISLNKILTPQNCPIDTLPIIFEVTNYGTKNLFALNAKFIINATDTFKCQFNNLDLKPEESIILKHKYDYIITKEENFTITVIIDYANGEIDQIPENNEIYINIKSSPDLVFKNQLFEFFSNSSINESEMIRDELNNLTIHAPQLSFITYPSKYKDNIDPFYINDVDARAIYYEIDSIPSLKLNGIQYLSNIDTTIIIAKQIETSSISISAEPVINDSTIQITGAIKTLNNIELGLTMHIAIVEEQVQFSNENINKLHSNVLLKMAPSALGTVLDIISKGDSLVLDQTISLNQTLVQNINNLRCIIFIQDEATDSIIQSFSTKISKKKSVELSFWVDMTLAIEDNLFNPDSDDLYVTGSFAMNEFDWDMPGSGKSKKLERSKINIYSTIVDVEPNSLIEYKYYINEGWENAEWTGEPNRKINISNSNLEINPFDVFGKLNVDLSIISSNSNFIYPNPFENELYIEQLEIGSEIVLYNFTGKEVFSIVTIDEDIVIPTSELKTGIYFIEISKKSISKRYKLIKL